MKAPPELRCDHFLLPEASRNPKPSQDEIWITSCFDAGGVYQSQALRRKAAAEWQAPLGTSQVPGSQRNADRAMQRFCHTACGSSQQRTEN